MQARHKNKPKDAMVHANKPKDTMVYTINP
jgi:hypothetical protein